MASGPRTYVAVCGPDPCTAEVGAMAEEVGRLLAEAGAVIVCGGLGGVMEAASRGAVEAGGTVVGILPGLDRSSANRSLTLSIPTGLGEMRNTLIVRSADALIAVAGEFGTLSEIAFALKTGVPVVGLETWELGKAGMAVDPFARAASPADAVEQALRLARANAG
jgi:uncharacterized protein (TIGR00725 family)